MGQKIQIKHLIQLLQIIQNNKESIALKIYKRNLGNLKKRDAAGGPF
jgi:hypothetical protein